MSDSVNHPHYYNQHPSGIECIEVVRHMGFNIGNVIKYCWRAGLKGSGLVQDLMKARWYLDDEIRLRGGAIDEDSDLQQKMNNERNANIRLTGLLEELNGRVEELQEAREKDRAAFKQELAGKEVVHQYDVAELVEKQEYILQLERAIRMQDGEPLDSPNQPGWWAFESTDGVIWRTVFEVKVNSDGGKVRFSGNSYDDDRSLLYIQVGDTGRWTVTKYKGKWIPFAMPWERDNANT